MRPGGLTAIGPNSSPTPCGVQSGQLESRRPGEAYSRNCLTIAATPAEPGDLQRSRQTVNTPTGLSEDSCCQDIPELKYLPICQPLPRRSHHA